MSSKSEPEISSYPKESTDYTMVTFTPDFKRLGMKKGLDPDTLSLLKKRVYDIAGVTPASVKVYLNGTHLKEVKNFESYVDLYFSPDQKATKIYEKCGPRWEVCFSNSDGQF